MLITARIVTFWEGFLHVTATTIDVNIQLKESKQLSTSEEVILFNATLITAR